MSEPQPFEELAPHLPAWDTVSSQDIDVPKLSVGARGSFADDLEHEGGRAVVRVAVCQGANALQLDFRDSDGIEAGAGFGLDAQDVRLVAGLAVARSIDPNTAAIARSIDVQIERSSWVGGATASDAARRAFSMARVYDAVCGALASCWPSRVGAGSTTIGAIVELRSEHERVWESIAGGEGATPARNGQDAWRDPFLGARTLAVFPRWLDVTQVGRRGSGGGGARQGGDGVVRSYRFEQPVVARVAIDRRGNPPHGLDRAGPPQPAGVWITMPGQERISAPSWKPLELPTGSTLTIETAGGAGHGFGGYGDIEFDASEWFGSKPHDS